MIHHRNRSMASVMTQNVMYHKLWKIFNKKGRRKFFDIFNIEEVIHDLKKVPHIGKFLKVMEQNIEVFSLFPLPNISNT